MNISFQYFDNQGFFFSILFSSLLVGVLKVQFRASGYPARAFKHCYTLHISDMPCLVAIVDLTHLGSATSSSKDLATVAQDNSTNQTADVLAED